jgi:hypothetical protein
VSSTGAKNLHQGDDNGHGRAKIRTILCVITILGQN